jgi:phosphoribosyl 1,2-cyclic phosphodiesterase
MNSSAKLAFWGVRGSTPTPERENGRYGGNTPCVELTAPDGTSFILDCGTGLRSLGNRWGRSNGHHAVDAHILVTHYHWDHVQGIPFFHPFFEPQNSFYLYGFQSEHLGPNSLKQALEAQMASPYFPVNANSMTATRSFREVSGGDSWDVGTTRVTTAWLNHPQKCLGYRLDTTAGSIVYATDNEPGCAEFDRNLRKLAHEADVLIYDAQYSPEQLSSTRKGWGHSSWLEAVKVARDCKARNLVLFHHDPESSDRTLDGYLSAARGEFPATWAATEAMTVKFSDKMAEVTLPASRAGQRRRLRFGAVVVGQTEDGTDFEEKAVVRDLTFQGAYLCLKSKPRLQSEVRVMVEAAGEGNRASALSFRGTVVHCDSGWEKAQNGIGVVFVEETEQGMPRD